MLNNRIFSAGAGTFAAYRQELFKGIRQPFYYIAVLTPLALTLALVALQQLVYLTGEKRQVPNADVIDYSLAYDLGHRGGFAAANLIILNFYNTLFIPLVILACTVNASNEFRYRTLKTLALRVRSKAGLALSKSLFAASLVVATWLSTLAGWFCFGLSYQNTHDLPFGIGSDDLEAIGKGLSYFTVTTIGTLILALFAVAVTFYFKSLVAGLMGYFIYNLADSQFSLQGAGVIHNGIDPGTPGLLVPFMKLLEVVNPFLVNSNLNRIAMMEKIPASAYPAEGFIPNPQIVASTPLWWSWLVLGVYVALFSLLAALVIVRRDID